MKILIKNYKIKHAMLTKFVKNTEKTHLKVENYFMPFGHLERNCISLFTKNNDANS